jgi:hypothetical protein
MNALNSCPHLSLAVVIRTRLDQHVSALSQNESGEARAQAREFCRFVLTGSMLDVVRGCPFCLDALTGVFAAAHPDVLEPRLRDMLRRVSGNNVFASRYASCDVAGRLSAIEENTHQIAGELLRLRLKIDGLQNTTERMGKARRAPASAGRGNLRGDSLPQLGRITLTPRG